MATDSVVPVRWYQVEGYFKEHGYDIVDEGNNKAIRKHDRMTYRVVDTVVIPRVCCYPKNAEVTKSYLRQIERIFHVTPRDIVS